MRQTICVAILLVIAVLLNASSAARMAADGNWGEAVGSLFFGPVVFFYIAHSLIYYAAYAVRGRAAIARYADSKVNHIALGISLLGILGDVAQRVAPPA